MEKDDELTFSYSPLYAKHVVGRYSPARLVDGKREPQRVVMRCEEIGRASCRERVSYHV